jgi:hypothetical protein
MCDRSSFLESLCSFTQNALFMTFLLWAVVGIIFVIKCKETNEWNDIEINNLMKLSFKQKEAVKQCFSAKKKLKVEMIGFIDEIKRHSTEFRG